MNRRNSNPAPGGQDRPSSGLTRFSRRVLLLAAAPLSAAAYLLGQRRVRRDGQKQIRWIGHL